MIFLDLGTGVGRPFTAGQHGTPAGVPASQPPLESCPQLNSGCRGVHTFIIRAQGHSTPLSAGSLKNTAAIHHTCSFKNHCYSVMIKPAAQRDSCVDKAVEGSNPACTALQVYKAQSLPSVIKKHRHFYR